MKCKIKWIDERGQVTPDNNEAVAMAYTHEMKWSIPDVGPGNEIVGYDRDVITDIFPICQKHLDNVTHGMRIENGGAWSFRPIVPPKRTGRRAFTQRETLNIFEVARLALNLHLDKVAEIMDEDELKLKRLRIKLGMYLGEKNIPRL